MRTGSDGTCQIAGDDRSLQPMIRNVLFACILALVLCGGIRSFAAAEATASSAPATNQQTFEVKGVVVELEADGKTVKIKHEKIPGYMEAMTMPFEVKDTNELTGLAAGDAVAFRMIVTETDGWIDQIKKLNVPVTNAPPTTGPFRLVREVEPLSVGDLLPEYHFINQDGQRISTAQFKGKALAVTFLFTRCPFPTYCPQMSRNFSEVQKKLLAMTSAPTNWHLLTISFDPEFDKPAALKGYAANYGYDPEHWTFVTGELIDITAICEQFDLNFWHDENGLISHNLRTSIIDASGRVQKIYIGNQWTSDEVAQEIVKAAAVKP